jgi:catechol 2,3-dioxygenase-like lactoylglutathione lyase family enzyme
MPQRVGALYGAGMSSRLVAVAFDAHEPAVLARFWGNLLDRSVSPEANGALLDGDATQAGLRFVEAPTEKSGPNRLHLHLTTVSLDDQQRQVEKALRLGAQHIDVGQLPDEGHVVLADPGGNEFCVIGPGNNFLAGCGHLGEVSCDGSRDVGLFWRDALAWPLVWDQDEETAVQAPTGGTKLSWGGPPVAPKFSRNRQRFDLAATDIAAEAARLMALGASPVDERDGRLELADPDGNEFVLLAV